MEKELGLDGKEQIEAYGVTPFIQKCKESVWKYKGEWEEMSDRVGFWADMEDPYITYDDNYIESEWWALKTIHEKGLLYKGHKIVPYCPRCGTALSSHEVAQGYKDIKETSATVRFRCADEDAYYLAWTTTPWTLPSNVCLCVNAHVEYCRARKDGETFILARDLVESVLGEGAEILDVFPGSDLVGRDYEPLFPCTGAACAKTGKRGHYVIADDYVTTTDGTGIVHNAPAFGEDDARVCKAHDMPFIQLVDTRGNMCGGTPWDGAFVKDADKLILHDLKEAGLLFAAPEFEHSYPFCWRCDTPLIYYARQSWFIKMTAIRDRLMEYNRRINWIPETIKKAAWATSWKTSSIGHQPGALLGHPLACVGVQGLRPRPCDRQPQGAVPAGPRHPGGPGAPQALPGSHHLPLREVRRRNAPGTRGDRLLVR